MSPEERIAVLETKVGAIETTLNGMDGKLDMLVSAFNMGQGTAVAKAKIGGLILLCLAAFGWIYDHIQPLLGKGHP